MKPPREHRCPDCGRSEVDRVFPRSLVDALLRLVGLRRYVCRACGRRFVDRRARGYR